MLYGYMYLSNWEYCSTADQCWCICIEVLCHLRLGNWSSLRHFWQMIIGWQCYLRPFLIFDPFEMCHWLPTSSSHSPRRFQLWKTSIHSTFLTTELQKFHRKSGASMSLNWMLTEIRYEKPKCKWLNTENTNKYWVTSVEY